MTKSSVRKIISDAMWQELGPAVQAAKHLAAGVPGEPSDREFQRSGAPSPADRKSVAGFAPQVGLLARGLHALPALGGPWSLAAFVEKFAS